MRLKTGYAGQGGNQPQGYGEPGTPEAQYPAHQGSPQAGSNGTWFGGDNGWSGAPGNQPPRHS
ncbi:hypothetical protein ACFPJ1_21520 [Kribbella qitaiheensis]|uniref:hypothetical protein n=1 Tax=Kribbella qitaiheensis TaxID=1544730 RepID=UPI00360BFC62